MISYIWYKLMFHVHIKWHRLIWNTIEQWLPFVQQRDYIANTVGQTVWPTCCAFSAHNVLCCFHLKKYQNTIPHSMRKSGVLCTQTSAKLNQESADLSKCQVPTSTIASRDMVPTWCTDIKGLMIRSHTERHQRNNATEHVQHKLKGSSNGGSVE